MRSWVRFVFLFILCISEAKQPQIGPKEVKAKVEEILKAHVSHKVLTTDLMERVFQNFLEELDPTKTYFIEEEVRQWQKPSQSLLETALKGYKIGDFSVFSESYVQFLQTIERRKEFEQKLDAQALPQDVTSEEFRDLDWASNEEDLFERLARIRSLQAETATKLDDEMKDKFFLRIEKRRTNREAEFLDTNAEERTKLMLSCILKAITNSLDAHTNYFTPSEANQFMIQVQQRLFGIGAQLHDNLDGLVIKRILENSPASQSNKVKINDKIIAVNHEPVIGLDITEAVELIRGEKGTPVLLTVLRDGEEDGEKKVEKVEVELIRNEVVLEETRLETHFEPFGDGVIASLKLFSFYQDDKSSSSLDIRKAIEQIKKEYKLKAVLLDLRGNAGGLLTQAVSVTGLFINKGIVVSIQDNTGKIQHLREVEGRPTWDGPLLVCVNRASASAAEIVAQTLQDYGRAIVVGDDHTFGKGSFQTFTLDSVNNHKVNPQGEYKVTRGKYYTVSGKSPQLTGVEADVIVPGMLSQLEIGERYAKFPLENSSIDPHYDDDLADLSQLHRMQLGPMYRYNLQQKLSTYVPYIEKIRQNSQDRIEKNKNYQNFLTDLEKKNYDSESINLFCQNDLQIAEAFNIIKDLVFLMHTEAM